MEHRDTINVCECASMCKGVEGNLGACASDGGDTMVNKSVVSFFFLFFKKSCSFFFYAKACEKENRDLSPLISGLLHVDLDGFDLIVILCQMALSRTKKRHVILLTW